jgi:O-antigen/teichoic acid export membrane protein
MNLQLIFINIVSRLYQRIFKEKFSEEMIHFFKNFFFTSSATILTVLFTFPFNILSARYLGPAEYGQFLIVQSVAMFLYIPMTLGIYVAIIKYLSESDEFSNQSKIISSGFSLIFVLSIITVIFYIIFSSQLSTLFAIQLEFFYLSIIYSISFVIFLVITSSLKGLFKFKIFSFFQSINGLIVLSLFLILIAIGVLTFMSVLIPIVIGYIVIGGIIFFLYISKYLIFNFDFILAKKMLKYGFFTSIGGFSFVIYTNIDKLLLNQYVSSTETGIYGAYYYAAFSIPLIIYGMFNSLLFPYASKQKNKGLLLLKIKKVFPYFLLFSIISSFIGQYVILILYGDKYPIILPLMVLFSFAPVLVIWYGFHDWIFSSEGVKGVKICSLSAISVASMNIIFNIILIPIFSIYGAIISTILSFLGGIIIISYLGRRYLLS